jgi:hypothetical protein
MKLLIKNVVDSAKTNSTVQDDGENEFENELFNE